VGEVGGGVDGLRGGAAVGVEAAVRIAGVRGVADGAADRGGEPSKTSVGDSTSERDGCRWTVCVGCSAVTRSAWCACSGDGGWPVVPWTGVGGHGDDSWSRQTDGDSTFMPDRSGTVGTTDLGDCPVDRTGYSDWIFTMGVRLVDASGEISFGCVEGMATPHPTFRKRVTLE